MRPYPCQLEDRSSPSERSQIYYLSDSQRHVGAFHQGLGTKKRSPLHAITTQPGAVRRSSPKYRCRAEMSARVKIFAHARYQQERIILSITQSRCFSRSTGLRISDSEADIDKQTVSNGFAPMATDSAKKAPAVPRPSASVLLVSPQNQFLLLQRVKQSSSFASAHVFPGGNVSTFHDGEMPGPDSPERHVDSDIYRMAAIRETFEESGIILARNAGFGRLIEVPEAEREEGRREVHSNKVKFEKWLAGKGGRADTGQSSFVWNCRFCALLTVQRRINTIHPMGNTHERPEALYNPDVHIFPAHIISNTTFRSPVRCCEWRGV
jgi:8-oxo-dGTP pyrophosphatase MutT (NUDIX family)